MNSYKIPEGAVVSVNGVNVGRCIEVGHVDFDHSAVETLPISMACIGTFIMKPKGLFGKWRLKRSIRKLMKTARGK